MECGQEEAALARCTSTLASVDSRPKIPATPLLLINQCLLVILKREKNPALNQAGYFSRFPWPAMEGKSEKV
jgi:hypothetical protein